MVKEMTLSLKQILNQLGESGQGKGQYGEKSKTNLWHHEKPFTFIKLTGVELLSHISAI